MPAPDASRRVSIALLALPQVTAGVLYGLYDVLSSVGIAWGELTGDPDSAARFDVRIVAPTRAAFACTGRAPVAPHCGFDEARANDAVIVPDLTVAPEADPRGRWPAATRWIRAQHASGAVICSVCTGSLLLADTGLLDGEEATTHWGVAGLFGRSFPAVKLRPERVLVPAGADQRIVTSGGAASWEDLALYLIARFCGQAEAVRTAKVFLLGDRSDGQLPYAAMGRPRRHDDAAVGECQAWIAEHYAGPNPVARMAARSGLAERTFKRRFKAATGYAPVDYVQTLRVEEAKQLLETTAMPTDEVGYQVGYEDPTFFRRLFKRRTGITPARYRQRFQSVVRTGRQA